MELGSLASPLKTRSPHCQAMESLVCGDAVFHRDALRCHRIPGSHSIIFAPTRGVGQHYPVGSRDLTPSSPHLPGHRKPFCNRQQEGSCSVGKICEELCLFKVPLGFWALNKHPGWGLGWRFSSWERQAGGRELRRCPKSACTF